MDDNKKNKRSIKDGWGNSEMTKTNTNQPSKEKKK